MDVKFNPDGDVVTVVLSRRNVVDLQGMKDGNTLVRKCENDKVLYLTIENDAIHYAHRQAGPGAGFAGVADSVD